MTTTDSSPEPQAAPAQPSWQLALLTPADPGRRNRRPIDGVLLGVAAIVIGLTAAIARSTPEQDEEVAQALGTVLGWADALWRVASRLHDEGVELIRGLGSSRCSLWVLEANEQARSFHEHRGWRLNGETRVVPFPPNPIDVGYSLDF